MKDLTKVVEQLRETGNNEEKINEVFKNIKLHLTKENILFELITDQKFYTEKEFEEIIESKYKQECFIVNEFPTYEEYIAKFKDYYEMVAPYLFKLEMGKSKFTYSLEQEPKDKQYTVAEIIEKLKELDLYDGLNNGFNGGM